MRCSIASSVISRRLSSAGASSTTSRSLHPNTLFTCIKHNASPASALAISLARIRATSLMCAVSISRRKCRWSVEGVLLYPSNDGEAIKLDFRLPYHRIRVWTLDLTRPWQHVHNQLLELVHLPHA